MVSAMKKECIVIKLGTGVLTRKSGAGLDPIALLQITAAVIDLKQRDKDVILVSSGAVGTALSEFGITVRPTEIIELQSLAAVGQARLMHAYHTQLSPYGYHAAQILLTYGDLESTDRQERILRTLNALLAREKVIPIINENDTVAVEELRFGDNDALSSKIAIACGASKLVLLTTVDGLLASKAEGQTLIEEITDLAEAKSHITAETGEFSVGGMTSKLQAAALASAAGIETFIANGKHCADLWDKIYGTNRQRTRVNIH